MGRDPAFDIAGMHKGPVPSRLQLRGNEPVLGIGGVILPESPIGGVAGGLQIAVESVTDLIAATGSLRLGFGGSSDRARLDDTQQRVLNRVIDPQATEGDAAWFAVVEQAPPAGIARDVVVAARISQRELAAAAPAANEPGQQRVAVLGRSVMPPRGRVVAHHLADRLRPFPADVAFMRSRDQCQPVLARLAASARPNRGRPKSRRDTSSYHRHRHRRRSGSRNPRLSSRRINAGDWRSLT